MYTTLVFDTLAYAKKMKSVGFTDAQAEMQAEVLAEFIDQQVASKRDILEMEQKMEFKLKVLEQNIVIKLGAMIAASIAITVSLLKLL